jgi:hypothetical protein
MTTGEGCGIILAVKVAQTFLDGSAVCPLSLADLVVFTPSRTRVQVVSLLDISAWSGNLSKFASFLGAWT